MKVVQTTAFLHTIKKLHANQKKDLDAAVRTLMADPLAGEKKAGNLSDVYVYKFKMTKQLTLLAYRIETKPHTITLLAVGQHENFYRDLGKSL